MSVCPVCDTAENLRWICTQRNNSSVQDGRLTMHDVSTIFYLSCETCGEDIKEMSGDDAADMLTVLTRKGFN